MSRTKRFWFETQERLERETGKEVAAETVDEAVMDWVAGQADYLKDLAKEAGEWPPKEANR